VAIREGASARVKSGAAELDPIEALRNE